MIYPNKWAFVPMLVVKYHTLMQLKVQRHLQPRDVWRYFTQQVCRRPCHHLPTFFRSWPGSCCLRTIINNTKRAVPTEELQHQLLYLPNFQHRNRFEHRQFWHLSLQYHLRMFIMITETQFGKECTSINRRDIISASTTSLLYSQKTLTNT